MSGAGVNWAPAQPSTPRLSDAEQRRLRRQQKTHPPARPAAIYDNYDFTSWDAAFASMAAEVRDASMDLGYEENDDDEACPQPGVIICERDYIAGSAEAQEHGRHWAYCQVVCYDRSPDYRAWGPADYAAYAAKEQGVNSKSTAGYQRRLNTRIDAWLAAN
ncbi:hypothetical protein DFH07DRAFT_772458 [Mycena maculata]|uniref:Uncharacterized protein n=1 Tax=Mycena maculata TaxID=230809 RepID=A0AAD7JAX3_9AGAR|nr:hypothetical protein DFH07DRAFT_772458 [Mycena maculata]